MATNDTFLQAAVQVLRAAGRPLTVAEIADEALRRQLIVPQGKTPRSSMSARLYTTARNNPKSPVERGFSSLELGVPAAIQCAGLCGTRQRGRMAPQPRTSGPPGSALANGASGLRV